MRLVSATQPPTVAPYPKWLARCVSGPAHAPVQALALTGKVRALLAGRFNVAFDDIRATPAPVMRHRLLLNLAKAQRRTASPVTG